MASQVFGCDDLREKILSYIPRYCGECKKKLGYMKYDNVKLYMDINWRRNECIKMKGCCNWCYYYVYEYQ